MRRFVFLSFLSALFLLPLQAVTYTPQTVPNPRVTDASAYVANPDGILTAEQVRAIEQVAQQLYQTTGVEMVTVALGNIGYEDAFDFSVALFNQWGIGRKGDNTGLLIFFALQSRDIRITTGGGLEGLLPDAVCERILQEDIIPLLRDGQYGEGLLVGNQAVAKRLTSDKALAELLLGYRPKPVTEQPWSAFAFGALLVALIALLRFWLSPRCPRCKKKGIKRTSQIIVPATYIAAGQGVRHCSCPACGHKWDVPFTIPKLYRSAGYSSSSGGGFRGGSFGGGSFGGGVSFGGGAGGKF